MAERPDAGNAEAADDRAVITVCPGASVYSVLGHLQLGESAEILVPPRSFIAFGLWARVIDGMDGDTMQTCPPPWALPSAPFAVPDIVGHLRFNPNTEPDANDPATFTILTSADERRTSFPLFAPSASIDGVRCLVECINAGFAYGAPPRALVLAVASLVATCRRSRLHALIPTLRRGRETAFEERNIYYS